jgi:hypothetical protein
MDVSILPFLVWFESTANLNLVGYGHLILRVEFAKKAN